MQKERLTDREEERGERKYEGRRDGALLLVERWNINRDRNISLPQSQK